MYCYKSSLVHNRQPQVTKWGRISCLSMVGFTLGSHLRDMFVTKIMVIMVVESRAKFVMLRQGLSDNIVMDQRVFVFLSSSGVLSGQEVLMEKNKLSGSGAGNHFDWVISVVVYDETISALFSSSCYHGCFDIVTVTRQIKLITSLVVIYLVPDRDKNKCFNRFNFNGFNIIWSISVKIVITFAGPHTLRSKYENKIGQRTGLREINFNQPWPQSGLVGNNHPQKNLKIG